MSVAVIEREANGVVVAQRQEDGFINGTTMCAAHGKEIKDWLRPKQTFDLFSTLSDDLGIKSNRDNYPHSDKTRVSVSDYARAFPGLITVRKGSPENGGGTWLHPDLAIQLAQWCNPFFAIQVSRWVREWLTTGQAPKETGAKNISTSNAVKLLDELKQSLRVLSEQLEAGHALLKAGNGMVRSLHNAIHNQGGSLNQAEKFLKKAQTQIGQMEEALAGMSEGTLMIEQTTTTRVIVQRTSSERRRAVLAKIFDLIDEYGSLEAIPRRGRGKTGINLEVEWGAATLSKQFGVSHNTVLDIWREVDEVIKQRGVQGAKGRLLDL